MKTAAIYARYSCENQTEQSIEGQLRVCQEYAASLGILIVETYIDRAMSGTNDNRAAFQQMLKDSSKKQFQFVIVYKLDRFARNKVESVINKKDLARQRSCAFVGNGAHYGYARRAHDGNDTRRIQPILLGRVGSESKAWHARNQIKRLVSRRWRAVRI